MRFTPLVVGSGMLDTMAGTVDNMPQCIGLTGLSADDAELEAVLPSEHAGVDAERAP